MFARSDSFGGSVPTSQGAASKGDELWRIKKHLREAYVATDALRRRLTTRPYFPIDYRPKRVPVKIRGVTPKVGLSTQVLVRFTWYMSPSLRQSVLV
jgi:hypothetical protein